MKLVPCLLFKRPEDSLSAARRRCRCQATRWVVRVFVGPDLHIWVLEASCGVPQTSSLSFDGSRAARTPHKSAGLEDIACDFVRLASNQSASE